MNAKFVKSVVAVFAAMMVLGYVVHEVLLKGDYQQFATLYRPQEEMGKFMPYMLLAHLFMAIGFVWLYKKGKESKPFVGQGVRFGLAMAVVVSWGINLIYYAVMPISCALALKAIVLETVSLVGVGVLTAWLEA